MAKGQFHQEEDVAMLVRFGEALYGHRWQAQFAKDSGIHASQLHGIVKGTAGMTAKVRVKLAAFVVEVDDGAVKKEMERLALYMSTRMRFETSRKPDLTPSQTCSKRKAIIAYTPPVRTVPGRPLSVKVLGE